MQDEKSKSPVSSVNLYFEALKYVGVYATFIRLGLALLGFIIN